MIDKHSPTWLELVKRASEYIEQLRKDLEREQDERTTSRIRGQIRALREVLSWSEHETFDASPLGFEQP